MRREKYVDERIFRMNEEEVRKLCTNGDIGIHYAYNCYAEDVGHILRLREEVLKDYPDMSDKDMGIWKISRHESIRHASYTTLYVHIPLEDYFKLKEAGEILIR